MSFVLVLPFIVLHLTSLCQGDCTFPAEWSGKWFQAGESYVEFNSTYMVSKGSCYLQSGDKYILQDRTENDGNTFKCLVIFMKHSNVIQYKETDLCRSTQLDLLDCCSLSSDNTLNTLIRVDKSRVPIPCPFLSVPYSFSYSIGGDNVCDRPLSRVDACVDSTKLLFRFSACADITSSQSFDEEMTCLGSWRENSNMYMIASLADSYSYVPLSDETQYRCFMFNKDSVTSFNMSQSGDATCNALLSPTEGSKTFKLTKAEGAVTKCKFPPWLTEETAWRSLDSSKTLTYLAQNGTLRIRDSFKDREFNVYCQSVESTNEHKHQKYKVFALSGCTSGYMCLSLYHRDSHFIQVQYSDSLTPSLEDACFSGVDSQLVTMVTGDKMSGKPCPELGRWKTNGSDPMATLSVGCDSESRMSFTDESYNETGYLCVGHWGNVNGSGYILTALPDHSDIYCFIYNRSSSGLALSRSQNSCQMGTSDSLNYRLSYLGRCVESTSLLHSGGPSFPVLSLFLLALSVLFQLTEEHIFS